MSSSVIVQEPNIWYREAKRKETFIWPIKNFTSEWSTKMSRPGEKFQSPILKTGRDSILNWQLEFTPNSHFKLYQTNNPVLKYTTDMKTRISFLTDQNDKMLTTCGKKYISTQYNYPAYTHSLIASMVFNKKRELLTNDTLRIFIEIETIVDDPILYEQKDLITPTDVKPSSSSSFTVPPSVKFEDRVTQVFPPNAVELENGATNKLTAVVKMEKDDPVARPVPILQQVQRQQQQPQPQLSRCQRVENAKTTIVRHGTPTVPGTLPVVGQQKIIYTTQSMHSVVRLGGQVVHIHNNNNKYVNAGEFSDIILDIQGKKLEAHRVILSNVSTVFANMFDDRVAEKIKNNTIYITNMKPEVGKLMLEFIYTNKRPSRTGEFLGDLMITAEKYKIDKLLSLCENEFIDNMSSESAIDTLLLADSLGAEKIKDIAVEFMRDNIEVLDSDKFKKIEEDNSRLAMTIYRKLLMKKPKVE